MGFGALMGVGSGDGVLLGPWCFAWVVIFFFFFFFLYIVGFFNVILIWLMLTSAFRILINNSF